MLRIFGYLILRFYLFQNMSQGPKLVFVFSGKRKSGKDFIAELFQEKIGHDLCAILRLSGPLKEIYARENGLDYGELLNSSGYKEIHRAKMIKWGEDKRNQDPSYFCRLATSGKEAEKPVWIVSDARRKTDISYFKEQYGDSAQLVRIEADLEVRDKRGFVFTAGVDDAESECDLDTGADWDLVVHNNGDSEQLDRTVKHVLHLVQCKLANS